MTEKVQKYVTCCVVNTVSTFVRQQTALFIPLLTRHCHPTNLFLPSSQPLASMVVIDLVNYPIFSAFETDGESSSPSSKGLSSSQVTKSEYTIKVKLCQPTTVFPPLTVLPICPLAQLKVNSTIYTVSFIVSI